MILRNVITRCEVTFLCETCWLLVNACCWKSFVSCPTAFPIRKNGWARDRKIMMFCPIGRDVCTYIMQEGTVHQKHLPGRVQLVLLWQQQTTRPRLENAYSVQKGRAPSITCPFGIKAAVLSWHGPADEQWRTEVAVATAEAQRVNRRRRGAAQNTSKPTHGRCSLASVRVQEKSRRFSDHGTVYLEDNPPPRARLQLAFLC